MQEDRQDARKWGARERGAGDQDARGARGQDARTQGARGQDARAQGPRGHVHKGTGCKRTASKREMREVCIKTGCGMQEDRIQGKRMQENRIEKTEKDLLCYRVS
jgi:hypothetical protein